MAARALLAGYPRYVVYAGKWPCLLTHRGWVTHICFSKLTIIGSDNDLLPGRCQAIIWTNASILLIRASGTNFSEILSEINTFSFKKMLLKMSSATRWQFCLGLNALIIHVYAERWSGLLRCRGIHSIDFQFWMNAIKDSKWCARIGPVSDHYILHWPNTCRVLENRDKLVRHRHTNGCCKPLSYWSSHKTLVIGTQARYAGKVRRQVLSTFPVHLMITLQVPVPHTGDRTWPLWWRHQRETFSALLALLWWKSTGHMWIPLTKASDAELWCFLWSAPEQTVRQTIEMPVIWDAIALVITSQWCHRGCRCPRLNHQQTQWWQLNCLYIVSSNRSRVSIIFNNIQMTSFKMADEIWWYIMVLVALICTITQKLNCNQLHYDCNP